MNFDIEQINQMEITDLSDLLLPVIEKIYMDYEFLDMEYDEFRKIVKKVLSSNIPINIVKKETYIQYINDKLRESIERTKSFDNQFGKIKNDQVDILNLYLTEIARSDLLTKEEELELFNRVQVGDKEAKEKLVQSNLRLVIKVAKKYYYQNGHLSFGDLIQEGNLGLIKAVEGFNPNKGYKFSTYASYWIKCYIIRAIKNYGRNIKLSEYMLERLILYKKAKEELTEKLQKEPTKIELANKMGITQVELDELLKYEMDTISLNILIGDENDAELIELIPNNSEDLDDTIEKIDNDFLKVFVRKVLNNSDLKKQELEVLKFYFGLDDNKANTLEQTAHKFNLTRERIRQIRDRAIKKIRESKYKENLAAYTSFPNKALNSIDKNKSLKLKVIDFLENNSLEEYDTILENIILILSGTLSIIKKNSDNLPLIINILLESDFSKKEIEFFILRYGIKYNLDEIATRFGYKSKKSVEKIELKIKEKIQNSLYVEEIIKYLEIPINILLDFDYKIISKQKKASSL